MGRNSKWIDSQPGEPVQDVVRRALEARLERLWTYLEEAADDSVDDTEDVHQLRVYTRRTATAMEIFSDWLPGRRGRWVQKQVKRVRKAAGEARDLDVLRLRWSEGLAGLPANQVAILLEQVKRRRRRAQWPIEEALQKLVDKKFERRVKKFLKRIRWRGEPELPADTRLYGYARTSLAALVVPYLAAGRGKLADTDAMHAFRIQSKQVRYAMEIFAGAFDEGFRQQVYPLVAALQDRLGAINDHVTAQLYLQKWREETQAPAVQEALDAGHRLETGALDAGRQEFASWWTDDRRNELAREFSRYLDLDAPPRPAIAEECA